MAENREYTKLEHDDPGYCKLCGWKLPEVMVHGPIAGGDSGYDAMEVCGTCEKNLWEWAWWFSEHQPEEDPGKFIHQVGESGSPHLQEGK